MVTRNSFLVSLLRASLGGATKTRLAPGSASEALNTLHQRTGDTRPDCAALHIPECANSADDDSPYHRGQFLARQDRWDDLADLLRKADDRREKSPDGQPIADLLAFGARADIINVIDHALDDGGPGSDATLQRALDDLDGMVADLEHDPYLAATAALAHVDAAWAWRRRFWDSTLPRPNRENSVQHVAAARLLFAKHKTLAATSAFLASVQCQIDAASPDRPRSLPEQYAALIDLDPMNPHPMRLLGQHLLPRRFGGHLSQLETTARAVAAQTDANWGTGGYSWVWFDVIANDEAAAAHVHVTDFIAGLHDILKRCADQEMVNKIAAYCTLTLKLRTGLDAEADLARQRISDCAQTIICEYLTELHPMVWAHASEGFDNNTRVTSPSRFAARGRNDALRTLRDMFQDDLDRGLSVTFTPSGPQVLPA